MQTCVSERLSDESGPLLSDFAHLYRTISGQHLELDVTAHTERAERT